jgi:hypothetical protein
VDKTSPLLDFNEHNLDDLLPYAFCCRSSSMPSCGEYERLRPSMLESAQAYELPVPGNPPSTCTPLFVNAAALQCQECSCCISSLNGLLDTAIRGGVGWVVQKDARPPITGQAPNSYLKGGEGGARGEGGAPLHVYLNSTTPLTSSSLRRFEKVWKFLSDQCSGQ